MFDKFPLSSIYVTAAIMSGNNHPHKSDILRIFNKRNNAGDFTEEGERLFVEQYTNAYGPLPKNWSNK